MSREDEFGESYRKDKQALWCIGGAAMVPTERQVEKFR